MKNLFTQLYESADALITSVNRSFVEKWIKRAIESAKDNAELSISQIDEGKLAILERALKDKDSRNDSIKTLIENEILKQEQLKVVEACQRLTEELFAE